MSEEMPNREPKVWRWILLTWTLLLLFGIVLVAAVYSWNSRNKQIQEECIAELERRGAEVQYGVSSEQYAVSVFNPNFNDMQLKAIMPYLKEIEPLSFMTLSSGTQISDESVDLLGQCRVEALHVKNTKISAKREQRNSNAVFLAHGSLTNLSSIDKRLEIRRGSESAVAVLLSRGKKRGHH